MEKVHSPCLELNCSHCCDPVKIESRRSFDMELPKDKEGKDIWIKRQEVLKPENNPEVSITTYDCKNFDIVTGLCLDHENRPNICRNTTCITDETGDLVAQQKKMANEKFIKIIPIMPKMM